jgi:hypothetical protein
MASRLIALNKNPGVTIAKAILNIVRLDVQEATGSVQLYAG